MYVRRNWPYINLLLAMDAIFLLSRAHSASKKKPLELDESLISTILYYIFLMLLCDSNANMYAYHVTNVDHHIDFTGIRMKY